MDPAQREPEGEDELVRQLHARARRAPVVWAILGTVSGFVGSVLVGVALELREVSHKRALAIVLTLIGVGAGLAIGRARALGLRIKAQQLSALARLGSRPHFVAGLVTSLMLLGRGCEAECDNCEPDPEPLVCEQETCPVSMCMLNVRCSETGSCQWDTPTGLEDANACTVDICDPDTGEVTHEPPILDDGNDCTSDYCDSVKGVIHENLCGDA